MELLTVQAPASVKMEELLPSSKKPDFNKMLRASALNSLVAQIKKDTQEAHKAHLEMLKSIRGEM